MGNGELGKASLLHDTDAHVDTNADRDIDEDRIRPIKFNNEMDTDRHTGTVTVTDNTECEKRANDAYYLYDIRAD